MTAAMIAGALVLAGLSALCAWTLFRDGFDNEDREAER